MKRLVIAAALAVAVLAGAHGEAKAHGGFGFGVGFGVNFNFSGWAGNSCGQNGSCSTCCCIIPGWSPVYSPPMMYGGLQALQASGHYSGHGGYPHGGYPYEAGQLPPPDPKDPKKGLDKAPGKEIEK